MDDIHIPCIVWFHGDPPPDLSQFSDPIRIPFTFLPYASSAPTAAAAVAPTSRSEPTHDPNGSHGPQQDTRISAAQPSEGTHAPDKSNYDPAAPVRWPDGHVPVDPWTKRPLLKPAFVDLGANISAGRRLQGSEWQEPLRREHAFYDLFRQHGPMDYQRTGPHGKTGFDRGFLDFGNYNFGVVAAAAGYPEWLATPAAGLYTLDRNPRSAQTLYGLCRRNEPLIQMGYRDFLHHGAEQVHENP